MRFIIDVSVVLAAADQKRSTDFLKKIFLHRSLDRFRNRSNPCQCRWRAPDIFLDVTKMIISSLAIIDIVIIREDGLCRNRFIQALANSYAAQTDMACNIEYGFQEGTDEALRPPRGMKFPKW